MLLSKIRDILLFTALFFVPIVFSTSYYEPAEFKTVLFFVILSLLVLFFENKNENAQREESTALDRPVTIFFFVTFLSFLMNVKSYESQLFFMRFAGAVLLFFIIYGLPSGTRRKAVFLLILQWIIVSGISLIKGRAGMFFGNQNFFAGYIVLVVPLSVYLFQEIKFPAILQAVTAAVLLIVLELFAGARAGILSGLVFFSGAVFIALRRRARIVFAFVVTAFLIVGVYVKLPDLRDNFRLYTYRSGLQMLYDYPVFGLGIGKFKVYYPLYKSSEIVRIEGQHSAETIHAHNELLELGIEQGILGLALFLVIIAAIFRLMFDKRLNFPARILGLALLVFLFDNLFSVNMRYTSQYVLFFVVLALFFKEAYECVT